ncbi:GNAT family N-acetyltransferase [Streptomyces sp. NPDC048257]|uniref:GNAT family N-acetyltransferase n=1 Tax=Streptomyces sp. NPDC048257 TaxID=3365526 RepID=UPI003713D082
MDITIRPVQAAEYTDLGEITARAYLADGHLDFNEDDAYLNVLRDVAGRAAAAEVLVAVRDERLLGGVTFAAPGSPLADIATPGEAEFRMLAVAHEARGQGAGEALVRACLDRARAIEGVGAVVLSTQSSMAGAHRIYGRLGFVRTPERDWAPIEGLKLLTYRLKL